MFLKVRQLHFHINIQQKYIKYQDCAYFLVILVEVMSCVWNKSSRQATPSVCSSGTRLYNRTRYA